MPWVVRGDAKYYYRSYRAGGRVMRLYVGQGIEAEAAAAEVERRRQARLARAEQLKADREHHREAIEPLDGFCDLTDLILGLTLVGAGFRRHARGHWRLRRLRRDP